MIGKNRNYHISDKCNQVNRNLDEMEYKNVRIVKWILNLLKIENSEVLLKFVATGCMLDLLRKVKKKKVHSY